MGKTHLYKPSPHIQPKIVRSLKFGWCSTMAGTDKHSWPVNTLRSVSFSGYIRHCDVGPVRRRWWNDPGHWEKCNNFPQQLAAWLVDALATRIYCLCGETRLIANSETIRRPCVKGTTVNALCVKFAWPRNRKGLNLASMGAYATSIKEKLTKSIPRYRNETVCTFMAHLALKWDALFCVVQFLEMETWN